MLTKATSTESKENMGNSKKDKIPTLHLHPLPPYPSGILPIYNDGTTKEIN